ncbi:RES protein [Burkholderia stagnalis]|uniref:RES family NAD+ phosphorylase n=1 Tax=Burkholderia stagnalis TaxID=1503054 RepID=UPI000759631A|nr:RES family NAD+ phosphorylase [Burkholderia stagnalis]AOK56544.1 RES protein [Burkholderia stagnalis]KVN76075.1 RES protein [Burkholderia stagnalis]KWO32036.1 RES protein [Burkholderia stagnalis]KWO32139.1 RES protein [Burkholderia stagnalis]
MILKPLNEVIAYRMHQPKWAVAPTSGAGAAKFGGRANRIGTPALYLALEVATAVAEYQQLSPLLPPGTLVSYRVTAEPVVDFTAGYRVDDWPPLWESFFCDWRRDWFNERIEPPSWVLGDEAIAAGAKGILFPSTQASGGTNLVLFVDQLAEPDRLEVIDPVGALPRDQASWGEPPA